MYLNTSTYHSTDLLTGRGVAHLVVHGTSGSTSYETIPRVRLESSGDVLSTVDMVMQRRDGPRRLRELDDDDDDKPNRAFPVDGQYDLLSVSVNLSSASAKISVPGLIP